MSECLCSAGLARKQCTCISIKKGMSKGNDGKWCYLTDTPPTPIISVNTSLLQDGVAYIVMWQRLSDMAGVICHRVANQTPFVCKESSNGLCLPGIGRVEVRQWGNSHIFGCICCLCVKYWSCLGICSGFLRAKQRNRKDLASTYKKLCPSPVMVS